VTEPHVVDEHDEHVRRALWSFYFEARRSFDLPNVEFGNHRRVGFGDRQHGAVDLTAGSLFGGLNLLRAGQGQAGGRQDSGED
jgi:hypothetical protein